MKLLVFLLLVRPSQTRTIRDLNVPFSANIFDYLDEDFIGPAANTTTSRSTTTSTTTTTTTTTTTKTITTTTTTTTTTTSTTTTSSTTTTTEAASGVVRIFHEDREGFPDVYGDIKKRENLLMDVSSLRKSFSDAINEIRSITEKQVATFNSLVQDVVRQASEKQKLEIDRLRDDVYKAVKSFTAAPEKDLKPDRPPVPHSEIPIAETSVDNRLVFCYKRYSC